MAVLKQNISPGVTIDTSTGTRQQHGWSYKATVGNRVVDLPLMNVSPDDLAENINNSGSPVYSKVAAALKGLSPTVVSARDRGIVAETIAPGLQRGSIDFLGTPMDLSQMIAHGLVDAPINFTKWAMKGFEGPIPDERYLSTKDPMLGGEYLAKQASKVTDVTTPILKEWARDVDESVGTVDVLGLGRVGLGTLLSPFMFDFTPDQSTKARQYATIISRMAGSAIPEGPALGVLLRQLVKINANPTLERVKDVITDFQTTNPKTAASLEGLMGATAGGSVVATTEALEKWWPDAPDPVKQMITAGGALFLPSAAMLTARGATKGAVLGGKAFGLGIVIKAGQKAREEFLQIVSPSHAEKAAGRALLNKGDDWRDRSGIFDVADQLRLGLMAGRNLDETTRTALTTPQMARNEASMLEAQLQAQRQDMRPDQIAAAEKKLIDLREFAAYQESVLQSILNNPDGPGNKLYQKFANRLMENRDKLFKVINKAVLKMDLGGKSSDGVDPDIITRDYANGEGKGVYEYAENRLRAVHEGRGGAVSEDSVRGYQKAFEEVEPVYAEVTADLVRMAEEQIALWRSNAPEGGDPALLNKQIGRILDEAYLKADMFEDVVWASITGMTKRRTEPYISPDGEDLGPQILIEGLPIGEYYGNKVAALKAGEDTWQSIYLWKLAGKANIVKSLKKINPEKYGKMANQVEAAQKREALGKSKLDDLDKEVSTAEEALRDAQYPSTHLRWAHENGIWTTGSKKGQEFNAFDLQQANTPYSNKTTRALEKRLEAVQRRWRTASDDVQRLVINRERAEADLDVFQNASPEFLGDKTSLSEGSQRVRDDSELGTVWAETATAGANVGRTGQEVENIISILKKELRYETGRGPAREPRKEAVLQEMIGELQDAIANNYPVNPDLLAVARKVSAIKKDSFGKDSPVAKLFQTSRSGTPRTEPEAISASILGRGTTRSQGDARIQETDLREIQTALQPFEVGPERFFVPDPDAPNGFRVNPDALDLNPAGIDSKLMELAPFISMKQLDRADGRGIGFMVKEGTPPTQENIDLVRGILWSRFKKFGPSGGEPFNHAAAAKWIEDNQPAISWLKKTTKKDTGFEELTRAESLVQELRGLDAQNLDRVVATLRRRGIFAGADDGPVPSGRFTESGFRDLINSAQLRDSNQAAARVILGDPDLNKLGTRLWNNIMDSDVSVNSMLNDIVQVLKKGELENGSNPALDGFKNVISETFFKKILADQSDSTPAGTVAKRLSDEKQVDVKLLDPDKLHGLLQNPRTMELFAKLYGEHAPALMRKISDGAYQAQTFKSSAYIPGSTVKATGLIEIAGNIGRMVGLAASRTGLINALVATGMGRRAGAIVARNLQGHTVERLVGEALIDPEFAGILMKKASDLSGPEKTALWKRIQRELHRSLIQPLSRKVQNQPGAVYEAITQPFESGDEPGGVGPSAAVRSAPRRRQVDMAASFNPQRVPNSALATANPAGPLPAASPAAPPAASPAAPPANPQQSAQTIAGLQQMGLPLFSPFAAKDGGYVGGAGSGVGRLQESDGIMSVRRKGRQLVG